MKDSQHFEKTCRAGFDYTAQNRFGDAEACFLSALRYRTEPNVLLALAKLRVQTGRTEKARQACELIFQLDRGEMIEPQESRSVEQAVQFLTNLPEQGCELTRVFLSTTPESRINTEALNAKSQANDAKAQFDFGICYAFGIGVAQDYPEAARYFKLASQNSLSEAKNNLGVCYENGLGVPGDRTRAICLYEQAAEAGYPEAQFNLGYCYVHGIGFQRDLQKGIELLERASKHGHVEAQNNLGCICSAGLGRAKDQKEALRWFRQSAASGYGVALLNVAKRCLDGRFVLRPDFEEAGTCLQGALRAGIPHAREFAGRLDSSITSHQIVPPDLFGLRSRFGEFSPGEVLQLQKNFRTIWLNSIFSSDLNQLQDDHLWLEEAESILRGVNGVDVILMGQKCRDLWKALDLKVPELKRDVLEHLERVN